MRLREFDEKERLLKANEKLTKYKTDAGADAAAADASGNFARGHKRFKGINAATKKQFDNDAKLAKLKEFAPGSGGGDAGNYFQTLASAWYNGAYDSGSLQKGIKSKEDIERLLQRGIVCPDGVTRKFGIDYNSDFNGVVISSDDYYEHADHDETDSRTGKPFGPYDYMEFGDDDLDESAKWRDPKYKGQLYTQEKPDYNDTREYDRARWDPKPKGYKGRKEPMAGGEFPRTDPLVKGFGRYGVGEPVSKGPRKGLPSRDQITSLKGSIKDAHGRHTRANLPEQGMAEDKGMKQYWAFKREWRAKHGRDADVPGYDSQEYNAYCWRQGDKKQGDKKQGVAEEWSQKYKNSINCSHPKGFSQKAHCAGKQKHNESIEMEMVCEDCGMCQTHGSLNEIKKGEKDSNGYTRCWPGRHAEGTKTGKNGGQVRNCVPNESVEEEAKHGLYYNVNKRKAAGTSRPASSPKAPTAQAWKDAAKTAKNKSVAEDQLDELSKDTLKDYVRAQPARIKGPAGLATTDNKKAARIVDRDIPRALDKYKDPEYGQQRPRLPEDSLAAMRRLAGVTTPPPAAATNGPRQYRRMPTAVQPR